ncbi:MAG: 2,3-bisphosphoglycerate-independent phosphoglycerate mutase [Patescibacteria group bacterium]
MQKNYRPVVLVIIDGFGVPSEKTNSTWEIASRPNLNKMEKNFPFTVLQASGIAVGLPWGEPGNSEVGHLTIGAGKIIHNYLPKISSSIKDGSFFKNNAFAECLNHIKKTGGSLHFMGLYSTGTVHAYFEHLRALLDLAKKNDTPAFLHLFTDGKDAYKKEGFGFYKELEVLLENDYPNIKIASIIGRAYAMDRNSDWEKTKKAYELFTEGKCAIFNSVSEYIKSQYDLGLIDDIIEPGMSAVSEKEGRIRDGDGVIVFNFREDSIRQTTQSFVGDNFQFFPRKKLENLFFVTMTEYDKNLSCFSSMVTGESCPAAFKSAEIKNPLAKIISENGLKQFHIAETEKYAHITYFLNGGTETPFDGEDRLLIPSPDGGHYDEKPEMSADEITKNVLENLTNHHFIAVNFANADMVGHTGNMEATAKAIEKIDECLGKIASKVLEIGGIMIITSDHGNAEEKIYKFSGENKTKHSLNPVPFFLIGNDFKRGVELSRGEVEQNYKNVTGTLSDIAPTILELMNIASPEEMTGRSLMGKIK